MKLEDFAEELKIIREAGFNPIAVGMRPEGVLHYFMMPNHKEATAAFNELDTWSSVGVKAINGVWCSEMDKNTILEADWIYL